MRFLVDTNIPLYGANRACAEHAKAKAFFTQTLRDGAPWCLTWGIVYEFLRVATHPRIFPKPLNSRDACDYIGAFLDHAGVTVLVPTERHWDLLRTTVGELSHPAGNLFHDIETAVLLRENGIGEIVTADNDFLQFTFLTVTNPVI